MSQDNSVEMDKNKYTLLELTRMIRESIATAFPGTYWLTAEINEIRENINGHCYLELVQKDSLQDSIVARSRATIWSYTWRMLKPYFETSTGQPLSKGMMILVEIIVEFHELYGLSFNIKDIDPVYTLGDLERRRAETLLKLEKEGIMNMNRSLPFPVLPSRIAVISSPTAAGYEDFTHQIINNSRKYRLNLSLFPALMQGDKARQSVIDALDAVFQNESMFDIVVILRGGGSAADLDCFNSYELAAHIAQFPLPVITGIGHERDVTIAGMVANTDLKTPTAVAEFLLEKFQEQEMRTVNLCNRLTSKVTHLIEQKKQFISTARKEIPAKLTNNLKKRNKHLASTGSILARTATIFIQQNKHNIISQHNRFGFIIKNYLLRLKNINNDLRTRTFPEKTRLAVRKRTEKLFLYSRTIDLVDPENVLKKGYAIVFKNGRVVKSVKSVSSPEILETKLHDGRIESKVLNVKIN